MIRAPTETILGIDQVADVCATCGSNSIMRAPAGWPSKEEELISLWVNTLGWFFLEDLRRQIVESLTQEAWFFCFWWWGYRCERSSQTDWSQLIGNVALISRPRNKLSPDCCIDKSPGVNSSPRNEETSKTTITLKKSMPPIIYPH